MDWFFLQVTSQMVLIVKIRGLAKDVVPFPFQSLSHCIDPSYLTTSPSATPLIRLSIVTLGPFPYRSPLICRLYRFQYILDHEFPSNLTKIVKLEISAVLHPSTITEAVLLWNLTLSLGWMTFSAPFSIRIPLDTKPLSLLLESGSESMPSQLPRLFAKNGPNSRRKTSPLAIPLGYSSYLKPEQLIMIQGNLPTAQAQSSKVPCAAQTTSSIVPTLKGVIPFFSFSPPTFFIILAISMEIAQSAV